MEISDLLRGRIIRIYDKGDVHNSPIQSVLVIKGSRQNWYEVTFENGFFKVYDSLDKIVSLIKN